MTVRELILIYIAGMLYIHLNMVKNDFRNKERDRRARERKSLNKRARGMLDV